MKKVAILIYPEFSIQEVANLMYLFRWHYDCKTVMISVDLNIVVSEEGVMIKPEQTCADFKKEDYHCLILPGCSGGQPDERVISFLRQFREEHEFVIGAICGGPLFLAMAGVLDHKKFTCSLYMDMIERFACIHEENVVYAPVVVDENLVTAVGDASRDFAIAVARRLGLECSDQALSYVDPAWKEEDFKHYLPAEEIAEFEEAFQGFFK